MTCSSSSSSCHGVSHLLVPCCRYIDAAEGDEEEGTAMGHSGAAAAGEFGRKPTAVSITGAVQQAGSGHSSTSSQSGLVAGTVVERIPEQPSELPGG